MGNLTDQEKQAILDLWRFYMVGSRVMPATVTDKQLLAKVEGNTLDEKCQHLKTMFLNIKSLLDDAKINRPEEYDEAVKMAEAVFGPVNRGIH